jgi:hypothetical protein
MRFNFFRRDYWFGTVDSRPLALFRICFALLLLKDALYHIPLTDVLYSDIGVLPRAVLLDGLAAAHRFSLMDTIAHGWMAALFFLLWAGVAVCLLVGFRTRWAAILNFIIVLSIHERNVYVLTGADTVLRVLCFWMMFLPLAQHYSIDAIRARQKPIDGGNTAAYAFPVRMIQLQVALIYLVSGILKLMGESWRTGDALYTVLQIDTILLPSGEWLGANAPDWLLRATTHGVLIFELAFAFLVFAPIAQPALRIAALAAGVVLHASIALTMVMPMTDFSLVMITSYLLFADPRWIRSRPEVAQAAHQPIRLNFPRIALTAYLTVIMALVIWTNIAVLSEYADEPFADPLPTAPQAILRYSGLWQYWDMFAPMPLQISGWITIRGQFEDGKNTDLFHLRDDATDTVPPPIQWGSSMRWLKYIENAYNDQDERVLLAWGGYYCRLYNDAMALPLGSRLATLEIRYVFRRVHARGEPLNPLQNDLIWSHWCYDEYAPDS